MIKRILVGLGDRAHSTSATRHAVELAQRFDASLTAVTVVDINRLSNVGSVPIGGSEAAQELREHRFKITAEIIHASVDEFRDRCQQAGVRHEILYEQGEPYDCVISAARYHDLMVFGLRHLFEHGVIDEPPDEVIRLVKAGVRPMLAVAHDYHAIERVLLAYSGSMESAKTMRRFLQLRLWPNITLRIINFGESAGQGQQLLDDAAAYCREHQVEPELDFVIGSAKDGLLPYAEQWNAQLIVVGNSAKSLLRRKLFGETALKVIRSSQRPLFLCQ